MAILLGKLGRLLIQLINEKMATIEEKYDETFIQRKEGHPSNEI